MSFLVEDGTGVANANAYVTLAYANAYFVDRSNASWAAASDPNKQAAIIRATDYIEARFGQRFLGLKEFSDQPLSFPRVYLYDREGNEITGMPNDLLKATSEYSVRALSADLWNEPILDQHGKLVINRVKVGPIEEDLRYAFNREVSQIKPVPAADRLLFKFTTQGGVYR